MTACNIFQVFYSHVRFADYDVRHVAAACLFLATKCEENKVRINEFGQLWREVLAETD